MSRGRILSVSFSVIFLALCGLAILRYQDIFDYMALRGYEPPARIAQLATDTGMRDSTRRVFYVNHPQLDNKQVFRDRCGPTEQSIVLGCYISHKGIYLLDVDDPRLKGVIEVTAAHETLHAHYDRLGTAERKRVDGLTADFFSKLKNDRIQSAIEQYRAKDPAVVPTELHSILGSEVRDLSPELETYYGRYFMDRKKIVDYSEQYEQTFIDLKNQESAYDARLSELKNKIEANRAQTDALGKTIDTQRNRLNTLLANNQTEEYNTAVPVFNELVIRHNTIINNSRVLIAEYNDIIEKRNATVTIEQELFQSIDSKSLPAEQKQ